MIKFRPVKPCDAAALVEIYRPYVEVRTASLEYDTPSVAEFTRRIETISAEFPYIVCELDGRIIGYAYAHRYKERFGYRFCAELTIYLAGDCTKRGIFLQVFGEGVRNASKGYCNRSRCKACHAFGGAYF